MASSMMIIFNEELPTLEELTIDFILQRKAKMCSYHDFKTGSYGVTFVWREDDLLDASNTKCAEGMGI